MEFLKRYRFRWSLIAVVVAVLGAVIFYESSGGIRIETDILASIPRHDPILANAYRVIRHLPVQDRIVIDIEGRGGNKDALVAAGEAVEAGLKASGLFREVGTGKMEALFPELIAHVAGHLPLLFEGADLETLIAPKLSPEAVRKTLNENYQTLQGLEGIGQADLITRDPLGLRNLVLARMASLMPGKEAQLYRGKILSRDGRHLLVIAELKESATDTGYARALPPLIGGLTEKINNQGKAAGASFIVTPVGAYRAALDNENTARLDMRRAILLTTLGIAFLLVITFPRPLVGLLALLPSTAGAVFALLICSFFFPGLSILAVSFGGALMAFTVDLGITYLMFLDRPCEVAGRQASREVQSGEILAALTTIGGFSLLMLSEFRVMAEIGLYAALGVAIAYLFVHWLFPMILPVMPPALRPRGQRLSRILDGFCLRGQKTKLAAATLFCALMLLFARPVFLVDINAMNSLSAESIAAEKTLQRIWGDLTSRVYLMIAGKDSAELQAKGDRLARLFREDIQKGTIKTAFALADLFPGEGLAKKRAADWRAFWTPARIEALKREFKGVERELGFAPAAFAPFLASLAGAPPATGPVPEAFASLLGISREKEGLVQVSMVTPGPAYEAKAFFSRYATPGQASLFDAGLFNRRLGEVLVSLFSRIAVVTGVGIVLVVFLFFLSWRLTLTVLAPVAFALVCTLGTLNLLGRPIDIPGIILWIVIMGMGIDYGIYYVCAYQRTLDERHPSLTLIRQAMFLAGTTTLIGFGVLAIAKHAVLKSIGITSLLGIAYSLAGAFLICPLLVKWALAPMALPPEVLATGSPRHSLRTRLRYRQVETIPRLFAYWKLRIDPLFPRLAAFVDRPRQILDIGCGYGVPSSWLLELFPAARVCGIDPDEERVRIAVHAFGKQGEARTGRAPDLGELPGGADTALVLDMIHMLSDEDWQKTLAHLHDKLLPGGRLILRATIPGEGPRPRMWSVEELRLKWHRLTPRYRSRKTLEAMFLQAGFRVEVVEPSGLATEEVWFVALRDGGTSGAGSEPQPQGDPEAAATASPTPEGETP